MALVPKTATIAPSAPTAATRLSAPVTRVASSSTSQVDALNDGTNISFDAAASEYQQQQDRSSLGRDGRGNRRDDRQAELGLSRLFTADSQVYAAILETPDEVKGSANRFGPQSSSSRAPETPVNRVISTYETNALVISGQQPIRGTSFSLSL